MRAGTYYFPVFDLRGEDSRGRLILPHSSLKRREHVKAVWSRPAAAVAHAGYHEEAEELLGLGQR